MNLLAALALAMVVGGCGRTLLDDPVSLGEAMGGVGGTGGVSGSGGVGGSGGSGMAGATVPALHRAVAVACSRDPRPPGVSVCPFNFPGQPTSACNSDVDCAAGTNGRCEALINAGCQCSYDECFTDADCPASGACECGGGNRCLHGGCVTDADCGLGGFCSPQTQGPCASYVIAYQCHTARDTCLDDAACGEGNVCTYGPGTGIWTCQPIPVCPL